MSAARTLRKILDRRSLAAALSNERARGLTIALANGVFDLLHVGHVRYLEAARAQADRLVVGVNSDDSTRAVKGAGRPILPERERAEIVAALECVDYVTVFDEPTAEGLIRTVAPDVHCKGTDYRPETVPEREAVRESGGRVIIVGDPKDHATRDLIRAIRDRFP